MNSSTIEVIARGVLIHNDQILLCQNRKHGHRFLPGGHVDFNELAGQALLREVREELGIELLLGPFLGVFESAFDQPRKNGETRRHHEINLIFSLRPVNQPAPFDPASAASQEDHIEFVWVPVADLDQSGDRALLPPGIGPMIRGTARQAEGIGGLFGSQFS